MSLSDAERAQLGFPIEFRPGLYRHWKGPLYRALFLAQDSTNRPYPDDSALETSDPKFRSTEEPLVVYVSLELGTLCVRSLAQWCETVDPDPHLPGSKVPRFKWVGP